METISSNFKKKRDQQRQALHNISRQQRFLNLKVALKSKNTVDLTATYGSKLDNQLAVRHPSNDSKSSGYNSDLPTDNPLDHKNDLNLAIQQLAQTFTFFETERLLKNTIPEFADFSIDKYRQSIQFGVIQRLKKAKFELSSEDLKSPEKVINSGHDGLADEFSTSNSQNQQTVADNLHDNILRFLELEESYMPADLYSEIELILTEIREKTLASLMLKFKHDFFKILKTDTFVMITDDDLLDMQNSKNSETSQEIFKFFEVLELAGIPQNFDQAGISTSYLFTPMIPKIANKILACLQQIYQKRSEFSRDINANLKFMLDAAIQIFKDGLKPAFKKFKTEFEDLEIQKCKNIVINMMFFRKIIFKIIDEAFFQQNFRILGQKSGGFGENSEGETPENQNSLPETSIITKPIQDVISLITSDYTDKISDSIIDKSQQLILTGEENEDMLSMFKTLPIFIDTNILDIEHVVDQTILEKIYNSVALFLKNNYFLKGILQEDHCLDSEIIENYQAELEIILNYFKSKDEKSVKGGKNQATEKLNTKSASENPKLNPNTYHYTEYFVKIQQLLTLASDISHWNEFIREKNYETNSSNTLEAGLNNRLKKFSQVSRSEAKIIFDRTLRFELVNVRDLDQDRRNLINKIWKKL